MTVRRGPEREDLVAVAAGSDVGCVRDVGRLFADEAFRVSVHGAFAVLARSVPCEAGISDLRRHEAVSSALALRIPMVPIPYACPLPAGPDMVSTLLLHEQELLAALEQVRGKAELGVTIAGTVRGPLPVATYRRGTGRSYLESLLGPQREADAVIASARQVLAQWGAQVVERPLPTSNRFVFRASCLVYAERIEQVERALRAIPLRLASTGLPGHMALYVTGPWAPYTFTPHELLTGRGSPVAGDDLEKANA
ncbi:MAG TPA: GvpL/GvpF family gas vesicle protein [Acidimicrobiales bacterium]|nr:GvpL/GvpF family gas vesicle protein [Acidimicrobiales bacterium]